MADPGKVRDNTFATDELSAGLKAARNELTSQVDSEEDRANIPYNKQVNVDMYSEENRQKRLLLKKDNEVNFGSVHNTPLKYCTSISWEAAA